MKKQLLRQLAGIIFIAGNSLSGFAVPNSNIQHGQQGLYFTENKGQVTDQHHNPRPDIHFKTAATNGLNIFISAGKIHYQWTKHETTTSSSRPQWKDLTITDGDPSAPPRSAQGDERVEMYRMDVHLLNANPKAKIVTEQKQSYYEQYYLPHTGAEGATAHAWRKITYKEVYPHIDWVFYINPQGKVEHDFIIHPGGKVSDIRLQYAGATSMHLNEDGSVTASTPFGSVTENTPYCYQQDGQQVAGKFILTNNTISFSTATYEGVLTIDPVLEWGTYFGGSETDYAEDVVTDKYGNVYITGRTNSTANIATTGAHQDTFGGGSHALGADAFLAKFSRDGRCLWATFYGGERIDVAKSVSCDTSGNLYMAGYTNSAAGIATQSVHQSAKAGSATSYDAFLAKFNTAGSRLWGTYYGGTGAEATTTVAIACDKFNNVYLTGNTQSAAGIATTGAYRDARPGGHDMFLAKFTTNGLIDWATYYGGTSNDYGACLAADETGNIIVGGYTQSNADIATPGSYRSTLSGERDVFLVKFNNAGTPLWATYYGGSKEDQPAGITIDPQGNIIIAGVTYSDTGIATVGSHQPLITEQTYGEGFCAKFSPGGNLLWGTYYGGENFDEVTRVVTDDKAIIYLAGNTRSQTGITTAGSYQPGHRGTTPDITSGFIIKMNEDGQRLWGTLYGGVDHSSITGLAIDDMSNLYFTGYTKSGSHIATPNGYQPAHGGGDNDAFLVRFNDCTPPAASDTIYGPGIVCTGQETLYKASGSADASHYTWLLPAMWAGHSVSDTIRLRPTAVDGLVRVVAHSLCGGSSDTLSRHISISPLPLLSPVGHNDICAGDTLQLTVSPDTAVSYTWLQDGQSIPGAATAQYAASASGSYQVITDNGICTDTSLPVTIVVYPLPAPVIVNNGGVLSTTHPYAAYQWYYNGSLVTGATGSTHTAAFDGAYAVAVTDSNNCRAMSDTASIGDDTHVTGTGNKQAVSVYPNPAGNRLYLSVPVNALLYLSTADGRSILQQQLKSGSAAIDISAWMPGIYILRITDQQGAILLHHKMTKL